MSTFAPAANILAKNTVLNFLSQLIASITGLITIPIIVHGLGTEKFGILSLAWVVLGYLGFFNLGLGRATTKFVAEALSRNEHDKLNLVVWNSVYLQAFLGTICGIVIAVSVPFIVNKLIHVPPALLFETKVMFYLLAFSLPFIILTESFSGILQAGQRFDLVNAVKIPLSIANFLIPAFVLVFSTSLIPTGILLIGSRLAGFIAYVILSLRTYPSIRISRKLDLKHTLPLLSFGGWLTISSVLGIATYIERFFIASMLPLSMLTFYTVPFEMVSRILIFPVSITLSAFPAFSHYGKDQLPKVKELFVRSSKYLLILITPPMVILFIFSDNILGWWLGSDFVKYSTVTLQILTITFFFHSFAHIPVVLLQGLGRPDLTTKLELVATPVYLVLLYFLIPLMGINGAAAAKCAIAVATLAIFIIMADRITGSSSGKIFSREWTASIVLTSLLVIFSWLLAVLSQAFWPRAAGAAILICAYIVIYWIKVLDDKDRQVIMDMRRYLIKWSPNL